MVWKIRQATVKGYAECEVGGGGGPVISHIENTKR